MTLQIRAFWYGTDSWGFRTMPISVPGHADHPFRDDGDHDSGDDADHSFRDDPDQLIMIVGTVITMPGMVIAMPRNVFHRAR